MAIVFFFVSSGERSAAEGFSHGGTVAGGVSSLMPCKVSRQGQGAGHAVQKAAETMEQWCGRGRRSTEAVFLSLQEPHSFSVRAIRWMAPALNDTYI